MINNAVPSLSSSPAVSDNLPASAAATKTATLPHGRP
jgi:hypothetical protein